MGLNIGYNFRHNTVREKSKIFTLNDLVGEIFYNKMQYILLGAEMP